MKWPTFGKKKPAPALAVMTGQPVHLNLDPQSNKAVLRKLSRMVRLIEYQTKTHLAPEQLAEGEAEFNRSRALLLANGINVPSDVTGIQALIKEVQAKENAL